MDIDNFELEPEDLLDMLLKDGSITLSQHISAMSLKTRAGKLERLTKLCNYDKDGNHIGGSKVQERKKRKKRDL